jgi:hypothetical protein
MHIKKNVFDNIFNMFMDMKGKTKDNIKAKMDLTFYYDCQNIKLLNDGLRVEKTKSLHFR